MLNISVIILTFNEEKHIKRCIESAKKFSNAIENAINKSPIEIKDMGVDGRKLIEQKYSISEIYIQFKNLYQNIKNQMN